MRMRWSSESNESLSQRAFLLRGDIVTRAVSSFANAAADNKPIHHDPVFAAATRFGRPTASGPHTTALLLALTASHFSKKGAMLGLEFWGRFRRAIYADETIRLEWMVVKVTTNEKCAARSSSCAV